MRPKFLLRFGFWDPFSDDSPFSDAFFVDFFVDSSSELAGRDGDFTGSSEWYDSSSEEDLSSSCISTFFLDALTGSFTADTFLAAIFFGGIFLCFSLRCDLLEFWIWNDCCWGNRFLLYDTIVPRSTGVYRISTVSLPGCTVCLPASTVSLPCSTAVNRCLTYLYRDEPYVCRCQP